MCQGRVKGKGGGHQGMVEARLAWARARRGRQGVRGLLVPSPVTKGDSGAAGRAGRGARGWHIHTPAAGNACYGPRPSD